MKKKRVPAIPVPTFPKIYDSFREPWGMSMNLTHAPFAFNGAVGVRKYRITVEMVEEPMAVIHERLEQLWLVCDNHHNWGALETAAEKYGYAFKGKRGSLNLKNK